MFSQEWDETWFWIREGIPLFWAVVLMRINVWVNVGFLGSALIMEEGEGEIGGRW